MMTPCILLAIAAICCGCAHEHKPSAAGMIRSADSSWRQGDFLSAAAQYELATDAAPKALEPLYDLALAYYRDKLYEMAGRYLDRVQPNATGQLRLRCLLLRGDIEYRLAMQQQPEGRVEGLERALHLYREASMQSPESRLNVTARYNLEVAKMKLPPPHTKAPGSQAAATEVDNTSAEDIVLTTRMAGKQENTKPQSQDRDW